MTQCNRNICMSLCSSYNKPRSWCEHQRYIQINSDLDDRPHAQNQGTIKHCLGSVVIPTFTPTVTRSKGN